MKPIGHSRLRIATGHRRKAQRGALLFEAALAVGVAASLVGLSISIIREQQIRSDAILIGNEKSALLNASLQFVNENRADLLDTIYQAAVATGLASASFGVQDLRDAGLVPEGLNLGDALEIRFDQEYRLLVRAVRQDDPATPASTLTLADIDPTVTGGIDPQLTDGVAINGEIGVEAVLFTINGDPMPPGQASRVIDAARMLNAAFTYGENVARGAGGIINFNVSGFADFPEFGGNPIPAGRFASIVSFGTTGVLDTDDDTDLRDAFSRCGGLNPAGVNFVNCLNENRSTVFGNLVFTPSDDNGDGTLDTFPAITGATRLLCVQELDGVAAPVDQNVFLIDCETTRVNGVLDVTGTEVRFANDTLVSTRDIAGTDETVVEADKIAMRLPSGAERDLGENIFNAVDLPARGTIEVQECPERNLEGDLLVPTARAQVVAVLDPWGRTISGSVATVERGNLSGTTWTPSATGDRWMARLRYTVNGDFCRSSFSSPINIRDTFANGDNLQSASRFFPGTVRPNINRCDDSLIIAGVPQGPDTRADFYELHPIGNPPSGDANFGVATVIMGCGLPSGTP